MTYTFKQDLFLKTVPFIHPDNRELIEKIIEAKDEENPDNSDDFCWLKMLVNILGDYNSDVEIPDDLYTKETVLVLTCRNMDSEKYQYLNDEFKRDPDIIRSVIYANPNNIEYVPKDLITEELVLLAIDLWNPENDRLGDLGRILKLYPEIINLRHDIIKKCIWKDYTSIRVIPEKLLSDVNFIEEMIKVNSKVILYAKLNISEHPELIQLAIQIKPDIEEDIKLVFE